MSTFSSLTMGPPIRVLQSPGRLQQKDSRVQLLALEKNVGMIPAVNRGISETTGEFFVKLDADDLLPPGSLKRSVDLLEQNPNVGFVYGRPRHFTGSVPKPRWGLPRWKIWSGTEWFALRCKVGVNCISQPEVMIRGAALREIGGYNVALRHTSDVEMWLRLSTMADVGRINGVDQGYYRVHPNSMQRTVNAGVMTDLIGRREAFISTFAAAGERLPGAAELEATVRRTLAAEALDEACRIYDRDVLDPQLERRLTDFANHNLSRGRFVARMGRLGKTSETRPQKPVDAKLVAGRRSSAQPLGDRASSLGQNWRLTPACLRLPDSRTKEGAERVKDILSFSLQWIGV